MAGAKKCSECGASLAGRPSLTKTCSQACRAKRSRRIRRAQKERGKQLNALPEHQAVMRDIVRKTPDIAHEVMKAELAPIVREAITDDVMRSVKDLVGLTPKMVAAIEMDLESPDDRVRQKAYELVARYTFGNPSVAPQPQTPANAPMQVFFQMPRPGDADEPVEAQVEELRTCVECGDARPSGEFVGNSTRCQECHDKLQAKVRERFGGEA